MVDSSNKYFKKLHSSGYVSYKEMNYFTYEYTKPCNLGKLYLLPKIHNILFDVPGRPGISNCGTPTVKVSEFLDYHLKTIKQNSLSILHKRLSTFFRKDENCRKCTLNCHFLSLLMWWVYIPIFPIKQV